MSAKKTITLKKFVEGYDKAENKVEYVDKHILKDKYVPYEEKCNICERIVEATSFQTVKIDKVEKKIFKLNSRSRYMLFVLEMIRNYTDIEIKFENGEALNAFNMLCERNLVDVILSEIPETEYSQMSTILNMVLDDMYENERTMRSFVEQKLDVVGMLVGKLADYAKPLLENEKVMDIVLKKLESYEK